MISQVYGQLTGFKWILTDIIASFLPQKKKLAPSSAKQTVPFYHSTPFRIIALTLTLFKVVLPFCVCVCVFPEKSEIINDLGNYFKRVTFDLSWDLVSAFIIFRLIGN